MWTLLDRLLPKVVRPCGVTRVMEVEPGDSPGRQYIELGQGL